MRAGRLSTDVRYARLISADRNRVNLPRLGRNLRRRCRRGCCRSCRRSSHGRRMRPRRIRSRRHAAWHRLVRRRLTANGRAHVGWRALALCDRNRGDHRRSRFRRLNAAGGPARRYERSASLIWKYPHSENRSDGSRCDDAGRELSAFNS